MYFDIKYKINTLRSDQFERRMLVQRMHLKEINSWVSTAGPPLSMCDKVRRSKWLDVKTPWTEWHGDIYFREMGSYCVWAQCDSGGFLEEIGFINLSEFLSCHEWKKREEYFSLEFCKPRNQDWKTKENWESGHLVKKKNLYIHTHIIEYPFKICHIFTRGRILFFYKKDLYIE